MSAIASPVRLWLTRPATTALPDDGTGIVIVGWATRSGAEAVAAKMAVGNSSGEFSGVTLPPEVLGIVGIATAVGVGWQPSNSSPKRIRNLAFIFDPLQHNGAGFSPAPLELELT